MTKDLKKRIHQIYGIALSIVIVITGICFMVACVGIYRSGDQPFSREAVAAAFEPIRFPVYLCLAMVVIGFVLDFFLQETPEKPRLQKQYSVILKRLHAGTNLSLCSSELQTAVAAEQKSRKLRRTLLLVSLVIWSAAFLAYGLNPGNYHQSEINRSMIKAVALLLLSMAIPFIGGIVEARFRTASMKREIELLKQAPAAAKINAAAVPAGGSCKAQTFLRWAILCVAVAILIYGFYNGGTADVLTKAINICTECVGLG